MKKCRECQHEISEQALACPNCGAQYPAKEKWDGWGYEYKSKATIRGIPLLHISFKYRPNKMPVPAKGIISIGQFGIGVINISQFGLGVISISQFTIALYALAQIAIAYSLVAQMGLYVHKGYGQLVWNITELVKNSHVSYKFDPSDQYVYQHPENIHDGFDVGSLDEVNIDAGLIEDAVNKIQRGRYKEVHSMLIFKDDKLVLEEYFKGHQYKWDAPNHHGEWVTWDRSMLHGVKSVTKSITSSCIGIAIDHGFIESVHQSIFDYLPDHRHLNADGKDKITIEHLLTMTSGLAWDEWGAPLSSKDNDIVGLWFQDKDPISCIMERRLINEPGTSFTYSGGNMIVLGEIIRNATKMNIDEFSRKYLFEPLGIDSSDWALQFENGVFEAAGSLEITPRDMVKIGVTFLDKGTWKGKRIISEQWVEKSASSFPGNNRIKVPGTDSGRNGYSYSWWIKTIFDSGKRFNVFYAGGWGGQDIMVIPELSTVFVFTGGSYLTKTHQFKILEKYLIPAIV